MQTLKFGIEKFDRKMNFGLWQIQVKNVLIQSGFHKVLKGKPTSASDKDATKDSSKDLGKGTSKSSMSNEDWEEMDLKAASAIRLFLAKNVLANMQGNLMTKELWEKLEEMYQTKGVSNRVYLKEQFHTLRMSEGTSISDHLSVLNGVVYQLETLGVQIDDEDKALRLIWSLPPFYEHMKPILIHGKEKILLSKVIGKLLSEEKRLSERNNFTIESSVLVVEKWKKKKKNSTKGNLVCWRCGQSGNLKRNCPKGGAGSGNSSKDDTNNISLAFAGDEYDDAL